MVKPSPLYTGTSGLSDIINDNYHIKASVMVGGSKCSGFEPWPGTLCCVLRQDTLLSQCLSPPRCTNGYQRIVGENLTICGGVTCDGLASRPGEVEILPAASCYRNRDKLRHQWALRPLRLRFFRFAFLSLREQFTFNSDRGKTYRRCDLIPFS